MNTTLTPSIRSSGGVTVGRPIPRALDPTQDADPNFRVTLVECAAAINAAAIQLSQDHEGARVEIRRMGESWRGAHARVGGVPSIPRLFVECGSLREGVYELRIKGTNAPSLRYLVKGATVSELRRVS